MHEKFDNFLFNLDEIVVNFKKELNNLGYNVDYTLDSVNILESYILDNDIKIEDDDYYDASCFLGELFRIVYYGKWKLDDNKKSLFYNKPIIDYNSSTGVVFSPFNTLRGVILRKQKGLLSSIIKSNVEPEETEIKF